MLIQERCSLFCAKPTLSSRSRSASRIVRHSKLTDCEREVVRVVEKVPRRGQGGLEKEAAQSFNEAIEILESDGGVEKPASSDLLLGRWKLLFTSVPGTESPVQRTFTGVDAFTVFQDIIDIGPYLRIENIVDFGQQIGFLKVEAEVNTQTRPIPNFVSRQGEGWAIFGKSIKQDPPREDCRLDIWFDRAAFEFKVLPFKIPYPVPFRLLGDETKAWFDITYLSPDGSLRLTRGNKGTLFVLTKEEKDPVSKQD